MRRIVVIIGATDDETRDEAFRAAVGLTLRGAHVHVALTDPHATLGTNAQRARATLEMMGHAVRQVDVADQIARADVVEVWGVVVADSAGESTAAGGTAHLVRPGRHAACAAGADPVLHIPPVLERDDADRLLDQLLAADRVVVW